MSINLIGRDSRALSKLFEEVVNSPEEYEGILLKVRDFTNTLQRKFIEGLRY